MILRGILFIESPIYRGNARKTLFTRDGDGSHRLVSLAGEIAGTAESLMDAFIGQSRNGRNTGLLNQMWERLYGSAMPRGLIAQVDCKLHRESYTQDNFFDLRMGVRLDEDRWAVEANANYKMETILRHSTFDFVLSADDSVLRRNDNEARLYYLLQEMREARFWFGAGKSKGLGRCRLEMDLPLASLQAAPRLNPQANHLRVHLTFNATNPVLVGWNWGKIDPATPSFAAIEGRVLAGAMRDIPLPVRERLEMGLAGPILSPENWKQKLADYLPRVLAIWLMERSHSETQVWTLSAAGLAKLGKGKYGLAKSVIARIEPLVAQPFPNKAAADAAFQEALDDKANMAKRVLKEMTQEHRVSQQLDRSAWQELVDSLGLDASLADQVAENIKDEATLIAILKPACWQMLPRLYQQVDQQVKLLQSDSWVDVEIANREEHRRIKVMILEGKIDERQWENRSQAPEGVSAAAWREFLSDHSRVRFRHLTNARNLRKSITNDTNFIAFLKGHRERARQELSQPHLVDFRAGGPSNREVSRKYGKPYDAVFMRMLSWAPSKQEKETWEIYVPGSTIKGAFRKRASQVLKTVWGESRRTDQVLDRLFGAQGQRGLIFFSDAYLTDPHDPERAWCSMDGVKMDPKTGQPLEAAKRDYLFAYGSHLTFQLQIDIQDIGDDDLEGFVLLTHLLQDFQQGDIPLGGQKTSGFGWVQASISSLTWLTADPAGISQALFGEQPLTEAGVWRRLEVEEENAAALLQPTAPLVAETAAIAQVPPRARAGFISHQAFGGHCGHLFVEAETLTPTHVRESGEPSFRTQLADGVVNGWDFFSLSPPEAAQRSEQRRYALPSRSLRGMIRHIYAIASDSKEDSPDISRLNPADSLFGWVGQGPNQALTGRVTFNFGLFEEPQLAWFKAPYPYGQWQYSDDGWQKTTNSSAQMLRIGKTWRLFPHAPLAPIVEQLEQFQPDTAQARYARAILPGARARFAVRFWNLEPEELRRLLWCIVLEPNLAHKMGHNRYLGFGSLRLRLLPDSHFIDWAGRYAGQAEARWRLPLNIEEWAGPEHTENHQALQRALNANWL